MAPVVPPHSIETDEDAEFPNIMTRPFSPRLLEGSKERLMFGLPASTTFLVLGVPALWILYTVGFLLLSRKWENDGDES